MIPLTDRQIADYFHRSFTAVDGLWFMKLEEQIGFDAALDVDVAVWRVMPKIQARKMKELTGLDAGIEALCECFTTKLTIEHYQFTTTRLADGSGFEIAIADCPWVNLLTKSNRGHLADQIGQRICGIEYPTWAREFGGETIACEFGDRLCQGCVQCVLRFKKTCPQITQIDAD
jgi:hypothetical protein